VAIRTLIVAQPASLLPQPTLLEEVTISCRLVIKLLNTTFKQPHSQILFSDTCTFAKSPPPPKRGREREGKRKEKEKSAVFHVQ
jgi:hypothetical protein